jgi:homopolymeric O-antigen transport system ATP-binding protein
MSSSHAIEVRDLGKEYVLGERVNFATLRDVLTTRRRRGPRDRFWALRDATFEVDRGEAVGVIGHNGAGKTTLLKLLSRITAPTAGEIRITGHVGSLLEVGTGFHPELTGRDNVFLNGAILGMSRGEIRRKFDEIVDFAGVERFIDTPVKRYSSGMYVRLAFAVAAHVDPDVLIVDEVLAVGDAAFQRKCLGKMNEATAEGRTILFVSHNMTAIRTLTSRAIWLDHGQVVQIGPTADVITEYLASVTSARPSVADLTDDSHRQTVTKELAAEVKFESVSLLGVAGPTTQVPEGAPLRFEIAFVVRERVRFLELVVRVKTFEGIRIFSSYSGQRDEYVEPGSYRVVCEFPENILRPRHYLVELQARTGVNQDIVPSAMVFEIEQGHRAVENPAYAARVDGLIGVAGDWSALERAHPAEASPSTSEISAPTATSGANARS